MKSVLKSIFTLLVVSQVSNFAHASKGIILKDDTNLDYYENDKYVKTLMSLVSTTTLINYTGSNFYLSKYIPEDNKYSLHACSMETLKCVPITTPDTSADIVGISFQDNGKGFVAKKDLNIDYYENNVFVKTITKADRKIIYVSYTGKSTYFAEVKDENNGMYTSFIKRCSEFAWNCKVIGEINDSITSISFNDNFEGYAVSRIGKLYHFKNDKIVSITKPFKFYTDDLFFTDTGFYTRRQFLEGNFNDEKPMRVKTEITKCDLSGNDCKNTFREHGIHVRGSFK